MQDFSQDVLVTNRIDEKASLNFVGEELIQNMLNLLNGSKCSKVVYKFRLGKRFVMLTDLTTFREII